MSKNINTGIDNTGENNSGDRNSGYGNSGDRNSGYGNSGDRNSGYGNSGYGNSGSRNSGDRNSGDRNSGYGNSGDRNSGYGNSSDRQSGIFNSTETTVRMFNKEINLKWDEIDHPHFNEFYLNKWISESEMTTQEKKDEAEFHVRGGYLKTYSWNDAWTNFWEDTDETNRKKFLALPNFDSEIFKSITGIDVGKKDCTPKEAERQINELLREARIKGFKDAKVGCSFDDTCKHCRANMLTLGFLSQDDNLQHLKETEETQNDIL